VKTPTQKGSKKAADLRVTPPETDLASVLVGPNSGGLLVTTHGGFAASAESLLAISINPP